MPGTLINTTRVAQTYNLTNKIAPVRKLYQRRIENRDGDVKIVDRRVVHPESITILARGSLAGLHDGVPHCPEVAKAIAKGTLKWEPDAATEAASAAKLAGAPRRKAREAAAKEASPAPAPLPPVSEATELEKSERNPKPRTRG